jgi:hypothetical protein
MRIAGSPIGCQLANITRLAQSDRGSSPPVSVHVDCLIIPVIAQEPNHLKSNMDRQSILQKLRVKQHDDEAEVWQNSSLVSPISRRISPLRLTSTS